MAADDCTAELAAEWREVLIIGAGFGGLRMLHECREIGLSSLILEAVRYRAGEIVRLRHLAIQRHEARRDHLAPVFDALCRLDTITGDTHRQGIDR